MNAFHFTSVTCSRTATAITTALVISLVAAFSASPARADDHISAHGAPAQASDAASVHTADLVDGEVRKIDAANKKITLKHGELKNLGMPGMTMVFQVQDAALLDKFKVGDKVRFVAEKGKGGFVATQLQPAP
ncbi:MAG: copper-binding protein [Aquabacterium sp.]|nr:MAG: copper-binding protein [Aquabacterium sp.]TAL23275.1 MAG: copper-binding protein [Aquabacterium sp.]